jgi:hypothetical protein
MPFAQRHVGVERWFYDAARAHLSRPRRRGIHVSDLLAPRKAYWARVVPRPPTDAEVGYFLAGRAHEEAFAVLAGLGAHRKARGEWLGDGDVYAPGDGIAYELDVLVQGSAQDVPIEIKTNRRPQVLSPTDALREYALAVRQLGMYCAFRGLTTGYLVEVHLLARGPAQEADADGELWPKQSRPEIVVYQITWTPEELAAIRRDAMAAKAFLDRALDARTPQALPECPAWMCGREHVRKGAPVCPSCGGVFPMAVGPSGRRVPKKICPSCRKAGNRVELERSSEVVFVPTCRWWDVCQPAGNWPRYVQGGSQVNSEVDHETAGAGDEAGYKVRGAVRGVVVRDAADLSEGIGGRSGEMPAVPPSTSAPTEQHLEGAE